MRPPGYKGELMTLGSGVRSITIRNLSFDGNRVAQPWPYADYRNGEVGIRGASSILITNTRFVNSPHIGITLYAGTTKGVFINSSYFTNAAYFGIWSDTTEILTDRGHTGCSGRLHVEDVVVMNSIFEGILENALYFDSIRSLRITGNVFRNNYSAEGPFGAAYGGQVDITICADNVAFTTNFMAGSATGPGGFDQGLELHGINIAVVNNTIQNHSTDGISLGGAASVFIANWDSTTSTRGNHNNGIEIHQGSGGDDSRPVEDVVIDRAIIVDNRGNGIWGKRSVSPLNHFTITNNCLSGNLRGAIDMINVGADIVRLNNQTAECGPR